MQFVVKARLLIINFKRRNKYTNCRCWKLEEDRVTFTAEVEYTKSMIKLKIRHPVLLNTIKNIDFTQFWVEFADNNKQMKALGGRGKCR